MAKKVENNTEMVLTDKNTAMAVYDFGEDAGQGFDAVDKGDLSIPFITILQQMSPQCTKGDEQYIKDAEPGMFYNSVTGELYQGEGKEYGLHILCCYVDHKWTEWVPNRGGLVGHHELNSPVVAEAMKRCTFPKYTTKNGNDLVDTYYVHGLIVRVLGANPIEPQMFVSSFASTKISTFKDYNTRINMLTVPGPNGKKIRPPYFANLCHLYTKPTRNAKGNFYIPIMEPAIDGDMSKSLILPNDPMYSAAKEFRELVVGGRAKADFSSLTRDQAESGSTEDIPF